MTTMRESMGAPRLRRPIAVMLALGAAVLSACAEDRAGADDARPEAGLFHSRRWQSASTSCAKRRSA
jgi:hypothetical protein